MPYKVLVNVTLENTAKFLAITRTVGNQVQTLGPGTSFTTQR